MAILILGTTNVYKNYDTRVYTYMYIGKRVSGLATLNENRISVVNRKTKVKKSGGKTGSGRAIE